MRWKIKGETAEAFHADSLSLSLSPPPPRIVGDHDPSFPFPRTLSDTLAPKPASKIRETCSIDIRHIVCTAHSVLTSQTRGRDRFCVHGVTMTTSLVFVGGFRVILGKIAQPPPLPP